MRLAAARGGLWLDEAWSAVFARDVGTPLGVFLKVNHDNNHQLNTLWLQLVGFGAPPLLQRALSIASGTATILVVGQIGLRRSRAAGVVTALLFALSPILVTYGSEARDYTPMLLALTVAVLRVDGRLADRTRRFSPVEFALLCLVGVLSHLTMMFGVLALTGWAVLRLWQEEGPRGLATAARLLGGGLAVCLIAALLIVVVMPGPSGFRVGLHEPFTFHRWNGGLADAIAYGTGLPAWPGLPLITALVAGAAALAVSALHPRRALYLLAILAFPLGVAALRFANPGAARYYLIGVFALLLLAGELAGIVLDRDGWPRRLTAAALALFIGLAGWDDSRIVSALRADPAAAMAVLPARASIAVDRPRAIAVIDSASATAHKPVVASPCGAWLFVDRDGIETFPRSPARCSHTYHVVAGANTYGLSGSSWRLYRRD